MAEVENRIRVLVDMKHVSSFGHKDTLRELTYGCTFKVKVGDNVMCPPTAYSLQWRVGEVVALNGGDYQGQVKYVKPMKGEE